MIEVKFNCTQGAADPILPAHKFWPQWLKKQRPIVDEMSTVRKCPAVLDVVCMGYILPMWTDVKLMKTSQGVAWIGDVNGKFHGLHQIGMYPFQPDDYKGVVHFFNPWEIITPEGYSVMITAPYYDAHPNIKPLPGVIDTDVYHEAHINMIFNAPYDTPIEIKKGTPIAQVVPFKREHYTHTVSNDPHTPMKDEQYRKKLYTKYYQ